MKLNPYNSLKSSFATSFTSGTVFPNKNISNMAKRNLLCLALLLVLTVSINVSAESSSSSSESKEKATTAKAKGKGGKTKATTAPTPSDSDSDEDGAVTPTPKADEATTAAPKKANWREIEKLMVGSFELQSNLKAKDFKKLLKAMEFKEADRDRIRTARNLKVTVTKESAKKTYKTSVTAGWKINYFHTFEIGKEFDDTLFDGRKYKGTITFEGKNKVIKAEKHLGFNCRHVAEFDTKGFIVTYLCNGTKAVQKFKRVGEKKQEDPEHPPPAFEFKFP